MVVHHGLSEKTFDHRYQNNVCSKIRNRAWHLQATPVFVQQYCKVLQASMLPYPVSTRLYHHLIKNHLHPASTEIRHTPYQRNGETRREWYRLITDPCKSFLNQVMPVLYMP